MLGIIKSVAGAYSNLMDNALIEYHIKRKIDISAGSGYKPHQIHDDVSGSFIITGYIGQFTQEQIAENQILQECLKVMIRQCDMPKCPCIGDRIVIKSSCGGCYNGNTYQIAENNGSTHLKSDPSGTFYIITASR